MLTLVPITAISSGLGLFMPLYILYLKGNVFDIGIAFALYNLVSIPSSLFWGMITDRFRRVKPFILLSVIFTLPILLFYNFFSGITQAYFYYALFAVIATAASPALNILVMGTKRSKKLPKYFSRYSLFALSGSIIAYIFGISIATSNINFYLQLLILFNIFSIIFAFILVKDIKKNMIEKEKLKSTKKIYPLLNTLTNLPNLLISSDMIIRIRSDIKDIKKRSVYQLLGAIILFNIGYYIFNTGYVPYLNQNGLQYSDIFLINLANAIAQIIVFVFIIKIKKGIKTERVYMASTTYRSMGYFVALVTIFIPELFFVLNILAYSIAGFSYALWNLSSSVLLYDMIRGEKQGYFIGLWTGVLGGSAIFGALISGLLVLNFGYQITFGSAIFVTLLSGFLFHKKLFDKK
ncbi:MAG: MFS transporter [Candidatus Micrarchaeia archaeon]